MDLLQACVAKAERRNLRVGERILFTLKGATAHTVRSSVEVLIVEINSAVETFFAEVLETIVRKRVFI
jgi:hypothetical protein